MNFDTDFTIKILGEKEPNPLPALPEGSLALLGGTYLVILHPPHIRA
ncbi:hypothetical protein J22TS3_05460 [Paenibacillus sp. J22TS3]|nr:hypothetical protein J22TS3_05460 [Paenibacillus sp. J22TS3]